MGLEREIWNHEHISNSKPVDICEITETKNNREWKIYWVMTGI